MSNFQNTILRALSAADLIGDAPPVEMSFSKVLYEPGDRVEWVYFPESGISSTIVDTADGQSAEAGMTGVEGAVGLIEACGSGVVAYRAIVQVAGFAYRARAADCRTLTARSDAFRSAVWSRLEFQSIEARQSVTCQSFHPVEARLARWLLESWQRGNTGENVLNLTQEFLAAMLGVQRTTVTAIATELQQRGLISYSRGRIELRDPEGLEHYACECRQVLVDQRQRLAAA